MSRFLVIGGGGKVALQFARLAVKAGHQVTSVVRSEASFDAIKSAGATPHLLSLEDASVKDLYALLENTAPSAVIFAAGAGGKGGEERTKAVDYEGAVKVFDAMEGTGVHRLLMVSATDLRDTSKGYPSYYNDESKRISDQMWKAIPAYMKYKLLADEDLHARKAMRFTIVRPGGLTDEPSKGVQAGKVQLGKISRETVARVLLACTSLPSTEGKTIDIMDGDETDIKAAVDASEDTWHGE